MNRLEETGIRGQGSGVDEVEAALRLIARLPAPMGLEDRVVARLGRGSRMGRVLEWSAVRGMEGWLRGAAAAAIVLAVAGGGWGVYSHVRPQEESPAIAMPHAPEHGAFANANAMRTPQTLDGPAAPAQKAEPNEGKAGLRRKGDKPVEGHRAPVKAGGTGDR